MPRLEEAKTNRSSCRECGRVIDKGEWRFGEDNGRVSTWFHLACAKQGRPRAFKPFEKKAAALMKQAPSKQPKASAKAGQRNPELEASLRKRPDHQGTRQVYADWLQSVGDPWGTLLALERAGEEEAAEKLLKAHRDELMGGLAPKLFTWNEGFIVSALLEGQRPEQLRAQAEAIFALRTAVLLRRLSIATPPVPALITFLNGAAPSTLRSLFTHLGPGVDGLAIAHLEELTLYIVPTKPEALPALLGATKLPGLRRLALYGGRTPLEPSFLQALLDSPLLRQLEVLELFQGALDAAGEVLLLSRPKALAHLKALHIDLHGANADRLFRAFKPKLAAFKALRTDDE